MDKTNENNEIYEKLKEVKRKRQIETPSIKDKVYRAIERKNNYIPKVYSKISPETYFIYEDRLLDLIEDIPDDIIDINPFPSFLGYKKNLNYVDNLYFELLKGENEWIDEWQTKMKHKSNSVGAMAVDFPLKSWGDYIRYMRFKKPVGTNRKRMAIAKNIIDTIEGRRNKYIIGNQVFGIFERAKFLRSTEKFLTDLYTNPNMVRRLLRELTNYTLSMIEEWYYLNDVDAIFYGDDWGAQNNMLISPELWRDIFKPYYREIGNCINKHDMHFFFHSCGNITPIIEDLLEIGVDVLHPIQPMCNDYNVIANRYSGEITVMGGIDVQKTLKENDKSNIKKEIYDFIEVFEQYNCGIILCPTNKITPDIPLDNIKFAFEIMSNC